MSGTEPDVVRVGDVWVERCSPHQRGDRALITGLDKTAGRPWTVRWRYVVVEGPSRALARSHLREAALDLFTRLYFRPLSAVEYLALLDEPGVVEQLEWLASL